MPLVKKHKWIEINDNKVEETLYFQSAEYDELCGWAAWITELRSYEYHCVSAWLYPIEREIHLVYYKPTTFIDHESDWSYSTVKRLIQKVKSGKAGADFDYTKKDLKIALHILNLKRMDRKFRYTRIYTSKVGSHTRFCVEVDI